MHDESGRLPQNAHHLDVRRWHRSAGQGHLRSRWLDITRDPVRASPGTPPAGPTAQIEERAPVTRPLARYPGITPGRDVASERRLRRYEPPPSRSTPDLHRCSARGGSTRVSEGGLEP
jgi:hypothetical protein